MDSYATMFTDSSQTLLIWQVYQFDSFQRYRRMQSSRTWHDAEINLRPIPTVSKYRILSFLISDFFCLRWSNGTHRNPEIVAWRAHTMISDDLFQGLCTSCLCCSCSPLPWWIWCPGTSGTVWKRWSMFAALNTSEYWQTEMDQGWGNTPTYPNYWTIVIILFPDVHHDMMHLVHSCIEVPPILSPQRAPGSSVDFLPATVKVVDVSEVARISQHPCHD